MIQPKLFTSDPSMGNALKHREKLYSVSIDCFDFDPTAEKKIYIQLEPPSIKDFRSFIISNSYKYDLILAWHPDILSKCHNAKEFIYGDCWIDVENFKSNKNDQVSFLMSSKTMTEGHRLRHEIYDLLSSKPKQSNYDILSIKTPPRIQNKDIIFQNAKFSIVVENERIDNWITEKLIDCFVTKTIPIYWGAPNVSKFFDSMGILCFSNMKELTKILDDLDMEEYDKLEDVMEKNYQEALKYRKFITRVDEEIDKI